MTTTTTTLFVCYITPPMMMNSYFTYKRHHQIYFPHYVVCAGLYKVALNFSWISLNSSICFCFGDEIITIKIHEMYTWGIYWCTIRLFRVTRGFTVCSLKNMITPCKSPFDSWCFWNPGIIIQTTVTWRVQVINLCWWNHKAKGNVLVTEEHIFYLVFIRIGPLQTH